MVTTRLIKDTEVAKQAWEILNQVQTQAIRFDVVMHGSERVARIVPAVPSRKTTLAELDLLFATLPRLDEDDVDAFGQDIKLALSQLTGPTKLWE
jgi:hypothetical protein